VRYGPSRPFRFAIACSVLALALSAHAQEGEEAPPADGDLSALPELIEFVESPFPPAALEDEVQADVLVRLTINEVGEVTEAVVDQVILYRFDEAGELVEETVSPDQDPYGFSEFAAEATAAFLFSPALDPAGTPVPVQLVWRYGFYFEEETEETGPPLAEAVNFAGTVLERETRLPLTGAEVRMTPIVDGAAEAEPLVTYADAEGRFEYVALAAGAWRVELSLDGYERGVATEDIVADELTEVTYFLERAVEEGLVSEVREEAVRREVSRRTLSVSEISRIPGNNGDPVKVIQNLPGVARAPFNGGLVVIRGSAPEDSRIYVGGVFVPLVFHFGGLTSIINAELISELEFIPGAFSVEYGRATGGLINLDTRAPRTDGFHGSIDMDVFDAGFLVEGPIAEGWSFFAAGRRSYIDAILPAVIPEDAGLALTTAPRYYDYQLKLQWDPSVDHSANLFVFGSDDRLEFLLDEAPGDDPAARGNIETITTFHRARLEIESDFSETISNRFVASIGPQRLSFTLGDDLRFILDTLNFYFRDTFEVRPSEELALRVGLDIDAYLFDISIRAPRPPKEGEFGIILGSADVITSDIENEWFYTPATFAEAEWTVADVLTLVPGVRLDYFNRIERWSVDPRFAARWEVTDDWRLEAAVGIFHQAPQPDESDETFGNPDLGLEWAVHYVLGFEHDFNDYLNLELQLFWKDLNDLVTRSDAVVERDGEQVLEAYNNSGEGRAYGAELLFRHELSEGFFGWISYTLSRSERIDGPGEPYRLFSFDQTHILSVLGSYELGRGWSVGARFRYVTGNPDTPLFEGTYDADADAYVRVAGETNSRRDGAFHQLDIRIDKEWEFDDWNLSLYLDVSNVYNRGNPEATNYNFDYSESRTITGLPIIPSLGLRGWF
jgi:outer membrane receptor protein involved in Fe transport